MAVELQTQTQSHYDKYPFIEGGENRIAWWRAYLRDFLPDEHIAGRTVVDVGSGIGEISRGLIDRGAQVTSLDVSLQSLTRCREINPEATVYHGSALELPFDDEMFDHAISIGVLHHTPDCRRGFHEVARVTAPGGTVVVFLYNFWSIYNPIFQAFKPLKGLIPLDRVPVWMLRSLQPFARTHLGQRLSDDQLRRLLGDKLWTPQATFHSVAQVRRWGEEEGLRMIGRKRFYLGYANVMCLKKDGTMRPEPQAVTLRCVSCKSAPMIPDDRGYRCDVCQQRYDIAGGIVRCLI